MSFSTMVLWYSFSDFESVSAAPVLCVAFPCTRYGLARPGTKELGAVGNSRADSGIVPNELLAISRWHAVSYVCHFCWD